MGKHKLGFVAFDSAKEKHAVAIADDGRDGEVRYLGEIDNSPDAVKKLVTKLSRQYERLHFCYEAGPTGYGLHRQLTDLGHVCDVVAPTMIPKRSGDRVKTNRRDSVALVKLLRAGELRAIWVPDSVHEAVRDLTRARETAMVDLKTKRRCYHSCSAMVGASRMAGIGPKRMNVGWRSRPSLTQPSRLFSKISLRLSPQRKLAWQLWSSNCVRSCRAGRWRRWWRPTKRSGVWLSLSPSPLLRRLAVRRFATPQQLMAFLGLVPSERTTGDTVRRGSITKTGNHRARRVLIEGAWTYRFSARVGETLRTRLKDLPSSVRAIAWKAQVRLCGRYRRLIARGKKTPVVTTAIARELSAFLWAIGQQVAPQTG